MGKRAWIPTLKAAMAMESTTQVAGKQKKKGHQASLVQEASSEPNEAAEGIKQYIKQSWADEVEAMQEVQRRPSIWENFDINKRRRWKRFQKEVAAAIYGAMIYHTWQARNMKIFKNIHNRNCNIQTSRWYKLEKSLVRPEFEFRLFAKKSLLSIASTVGKLIAMDKATQIKSRPSTTRVKVILDLMKKLPNRIRLQFVDGKSGKLIEVFQEIVYDNLPLYCNYCKHQGHVEDSCRLILKRNQNNKQIDDTIEVASKVTIDSEKYQGYAREILNEKRKVVDVDQSKTTSLDRQLVVVTSEQNRAHSMNVVTSNIGVQTTSENKGETPRVGVDAPRVGSGQKIMDSRHELMDTSNVEDTENSGQHVLKVETKNATKNWTLVAHKNSPSNRSLSPTSQNNSPCSENGVTENFHDSEKRQDISNASRDLLCLNSFDALSKTTGKQVKLTQNDNDLIQEKQVSPPTLNSKLSPEAPVFVPKCVIAKKNESRALVSNTIDLGEDSPDEDEEDNMLDMGEDSLDEDEEDMLDICFDRVAREGDISPRQQRSGSNKSKKKTHGRQHSWDGKMTNEFISRHLLMRQAKQNHLTVSIGSTRSNKSIKKV
ncbi:hypothetical protein H5410_021148 [Solanum commersonii]|uniref:DUF4283 domain-containing protein n=1 Tax=Solanum commersonii TaxID=4109 RepID=A0A9J5ZA56_SOLCO|nr:hypothetical protein H5410_021148 [Solanum commersonii]